jgi:tetratricopeptide (TPR) repeat protein
VLIVIVLCFVVWFSASWKSKPHSFNATPENIEAENLVKLGMQHFQNKEFESALKDFTEAIELNPKYIEAYRNRAAVYKALDNTSQEFLDRERAAKLEVDQDFADSIGRYIFRYLVSLVMLAPGVSYIMASKGHNVITGFLMGLLLGPLGLIIAFLLPEKSSRIDYELDKSVHRNPDQSVTDATSPCPSCGRVNSVRTKVCPRCETRLSGT